LISERIVDNEVDQHVQPKTKSQARTPISGQAQFANSIALYNSALKSAFRLKVETPSAKPCGWMCADQFESEVKAKYRDLRLQLAGGKLAAAVFVLPFAQ